MAAAADDDDDDDQPRAMTRRATAVLRSVTPCRTGSFVSLWTGEKTKPAAIEWTLVNVGKFVVVASNFRYPKCVTLFPCRPAVGIHLSPCHPPTSF